MTEAHQAPLSMGILQTRILEWVIVPPSTDLSNPGIEPESYVSCIGRQALYQTLDNYQFTLKYMIT